LLPIPARIGTAKLRIDDTRHGYVANSTGTPALAQAPMTRAQTNSVRRFVTRAAMSMALALPTILGKSLGLKTT
jgi:hypothetical protein